MKKAIVLISFLMSWSFVGLAGEIIKTPMQDFQSVAGMDYVFELKTTKFDKVILDCQSFITGISFSNQGILKSNIYLDMFMCEDVVNYMIESKNESLPICIGLDVEGNELYFSRETSECK